MSHYNNGGLFNPAYHDSETLEIDRGSSRKSHHSNPYDMDQASWQRGTAGWGASETLPTYNDEQGQAPWGSGQGSWRGMSGMAMDLLSPPPESPRWRHQDPAHHGLLIDPMMHYNTHALQHPPSRPAASGNVSMRQRGTRKMSMFPGGGAALDRLGLTEEDIRDEMESEEQDLVRDLVAMSTQDRIRAIRDLPMSFDDKKHIRSQVLECKSSKKAHQLSCFTDCSEHISLSFRRCRVNLASARQALTLWQGTMKEIGGKFGTSILSYFLFLKWLLMFNIFSFLVNFSFITIPQLISQDAQFTEDGAFRGLEILTGAGYFNQTVMYYGGYSNMTIEGPSKYNMPLAYLFTIAAYMVLCGVSLIYSMAGSFRRNFVLADAASGGAWQLLCSWDFNVVNERAVRQRKNNLRVQLKESLSEKTQHALLSVSERLKHFAIHLFTWLLSIGLAAASCAAIYYLSQFDQKKSNTAEGSDPLLAEASTLLLPFVVSLSNLVVPLIFSLFNKIEHYSNPRMQIYAIIIRNVLLKMSILGILCYYWMNEVAKKDSCWESFVGQALYRLVIVDFFFVMLGSFFGEFLSKVIGTKCLPRMGVPEFDIARNVLDLIYSQTLAWIGIYFSPLLPVIQMIKFFILFYLKKVSLMNNCQPPRRSGRAAQMQTIFIALLFIPSFVGALSMVAYTVWSLEPSKHCGPFRGHDTPFRVVSNWMESLSRDGGPDWVVWIYEKVIRSELFFFLLTLLILVLIYFFWQVTQGRKLLIILLRQRIVNEGKDKAFLLEKLQTHQKAKKSLPPTKSTHRAQKQQKSNRRWQTTPDYDHEFESRPPQDPTLPASSALVQAIVARQQADQEFESLPPQDPTLLGSGALMQAMAARQQADQELESLPPQDPTLLGSGALMQAMAARQQADQDFGSRPDLTPLSSSALTQAMLARQRVEQD